MAARIQGLVSIPMTDAGTVNSMIKFYVVFSGDMGMIRKSACIHM